MHRTRNAAYGQPYRGFESLPLRQSFARTRLILEGYRTPRFIPLLAFVPSLLQFPPKLAIERIRAAAAQRDGKAQQPPQQHIFVAASHPIEAVGPISDRDEQHLDGRSRSKEPREQPEDERNAAQCLDQARGPKPESRRRVTEIGKGFEDGLVRAVQELRINEHDQIPD